MKRFKKIYIEITNLCNLSCSFCPQTKRKPEFMKVETFEQILAQIKPYTDYIYLHVKGEPFLHPKLDKFLDLCMEYDIKVNITTNGTLIKQSMSKILLKPALRQINFSLHSLSGNKEEISESEYISNILSCVNTIQSSTGVLISFRFWNLRKDNGENLRNKKNRYLLEAIEQEYNLDYEIQEKVIPGRGIKIADKIYINQDFVFKWPGLEETEDDGIGFCHGLRNQVAILVDGTVVPCCLDGEGVINLGNIKEQPFCDILTSKRTTDIYEGFSGRYAVEELCKKCGFRQKFGDGQEDL